MRLSPASRGGIARWAGGSAALVAAALWIYWPVLRGAWIWDDGLEVANNPALRLGSGWWLPWIDPQGMDYFPLKDSFQWTEWRLWGNEVMGYHLASVILHAFSGVLLWRVLDRLAVRLAWIGALLFVVHPAAVESVAWISEQKNILSLIFVLLSFLAFLRYEDSGRTTIYIWSLVAFLAALLCKTTVVMYPVFLGVERDLRARWMSPEAANPFRGRPARPAGPPKAWRRRKAALHPTIPFFVLAAAFGAVTVWFQRTRAIGLHGGMPSLVHRLNSAGWSLLAYCREALFPRHLMPVYPAWPAAAGTGGVLVLAVAAAAWLWLFRWSATSRLRQGFGGQAGRAAPNRVLARTRTMASAPGGRAPPTAILALSWFGLNLVPVLGIIPMSYLRVAPRADHFLYLALPAATGLTAAALAALIQILRDRHPRSEDDPAARTVAILGGCAAAIAAGALALASRSYTRTFVNEATLWESAVSFNPGSWFAQNNWGKVLLDRGDPRAAAAILSTAVRLQPKSAEAHANLGNAYAALGQGDSALAEYRQAVALDPGFAGAHYDLGQALLVKGDSSGGALELTEAVRLNPHYAAAHNNLGLALARLGNAAEAMQEYRRAVELDPALPEAHLNLGNALLRADHATEAVAEYRAALRLNERYAAAHRNLAVALGKLGQRKEAEAEYDEATRLVQAAARRFQEEKSGGPPLLPGKP